MSHISYSDDELPTPTYYCSECKTNTVGFSVCLKCNPKTYEVKKPDVIKAEFDNCKCKGHPFNCYNYPYDCGCNEKAAMSVGKLDTSDANLGSTKKGYAVPNDSVYTKEIWNAAIEEAIIITAKNLPITSDWLDRIRKLKK